MEKQDKSHLWKPGQSGNPLGRPHGLLRYLREKTNGGKELLDILLSIARGEPQAIPKTMRMSDGTRVELDLPADALIPDLEIRYKAATQLKEHYWGKAPDKVEVTGPEGEPLFDPKHLPEAALALYAALVEALADPVKDAIDVTPEAKVLPEHSDKA